MTENRSKPLVYGEAKKKYQIMLTASASEMLGELAATLGVTRSELVEQLTRALYATGDESLMRAFLARGEGDRP